MSNLITRAKEAVMREQQIAENTRKAKEKWESEATQRAQQKALEEELFPYTTSGNVSQTVFIGTFYFPAVLNNGDVFKGISDPMPSCRCGNPQGANYYTNHGYEYALCHTCANRKKKEIGGHVARSIREEALTKIAKMRHQRYLQQLEEEKRKQEQEAIRLRVQRQTARLAVEDKS